MIKIKPVIMAGGIGSRLWPLSRPLYPKQFIKLFNGLSLLQQTLVRNKPFGKPAIIISEEHRFIAAEQIREIDIEADLIVEPYPKNTAPCAIIGALLAKKENISKVLLLPADHYIEDNEKYLHDVNKSFIYSDTIATIGIKPNFAHTGYGYIEVGEQLDNHSFEVKKFVEKPSKKLAQNYLNDGNYFWNSGILIFNTNHMIKQFKLLQNELFNKVRSSFNSASKNYGFTRIESSHYASISPISIDYSIMENTTNMVMIKGSFDWSDLGSWNSFWDISAKDEQNNCFEGDVITCDVNGSYIRSEGKLTAVIGLDNIIVINTGDAVLVASKSKTEDIKLIANKFEKRFKQ